MVNPSQARVGGVDLCVWRTSVAVFPGLNLSVCRHIPHVMDRWCGGGSFALCLMVVARESCPFPVVNLSV